jgi:membrane protein
MRLAGNMRLIGRGLTFRKFVLGMKDALVRHDTTDSAATVTYYGFLALFPFLLLLVALAGLIITPARAEELVEQLYRFAPGPLTEIVGDRIRQLGQQQNGSLLGFGALGALWASSGAVSAIIRALNSAYEVKDSRPYWKTQGLALLMTVFMGLVALAAGLLALGAPALADHVGGAAGTALTWLRLPVAGLLMMFLWAVVYYLLPDVEQDFKFITPGSVLGVAAWGVATWGFGVYVSNFARYDKVYGSIAGIVVLLVWMWLSSLILLVGAEINSLIEHYSPAGKRKGEKELPGARRPSGSRAREPVPAPRRPPRTGDGQGAGPQGHDPRP